MKTILVLLLSCSGLLGQKFASIGDYGDSGSDELAVANLVKSWNPDFIITLGDNNYNEGLWSTIDENIGQYFHEFIFPYIGSYGSGADTNRFFPSPGNHDHHNLDDLIYLQPYLDYFDLFPYSGTSGNERYYDFVWGNVHFFSVNSCIIEPDGYRHPSIQSAWLEAQLDNCTINHSHWKFVYFHHAPYSSGSHGSVLWMRWPFKEWGADVVMAGHDHTYERLIIDELPYFVNGLGGKNRYLFGTPIPGSIVRYREKYGAMLMTADESKLTFSFFNIDNELIDFFEIINPLSSLNNDISTTSGNYSLEQNHPNPFNPSTNIYYSIPELSFVTLKVYDVLGSEIATLINEEKPAGTYQVEFNANNLTSGIYIYRLRSGNFVASKKLILLK